MRARLLQANRVFHTMLAGTPPATYPQIRLPIKGVRGACGSVYHKHGVFYEGVGADEYHEKKQGMPLVHTEGQLILTRGRADGVHLPPSSPVSSLGVALCYGIYADVSHSDDS